MFMFSCCKLSDEQKLIREQRKSLLEACKNGDENKVRELLQVEAIREHLRHNNRAVMAALAYSEKTGDSTVFLLVVGANINKQAVSSANISSV